MGFLRVPNLVPWLISNVNILDVRAWIINDQFCCICLHFSYVCYPGSQFLTWQGRDKKEKIARGVGGRLFEEGDYFKYFRQRGAIIQGRRLIRGRLLFEEIWYSWYDYLWEVALQRGLTLLSFTFSVFLFSQSWIEREVVYKTKASFQRLNIVNINIKTTSKLTMCQLFYTRTNFKKCSVQCKLLVTSSRFTSSSTASASKSFFWWQSGWWTRVLD